MAGSGQSSNRDYQVRETGRTGESEYGAEEKWRLAIGTVSFADAW